MPKRIQVCLENRLAAPEARVQLCALGYKIEVESCLDHCTRCSHAAIGLVDGRLLTAPSTEEFLRMLGRADRWR